MSIRICRSILNSTSQRPVELMRYPLVRIPAIRPSVCLSVNNILHLYDSSVTDYRRDPFMVSYLWTHGLVVRMQFWSSPKPMGPQRGT